MRLTKAERSFVEVARVARLATSDAEGTPHNVPICPVLDGGRIYFGSEATAKKVRNVEVNPRVAIVFDDYVETWEHLRGILFVGTARIVPPADFARVREKLYQKFLTYESVATLEEGESVIVEVTPRRKASWGFAI